MDSPFDPPRSAQCAVQRNRLRVINELKYRRVKKTVAWAMEVLTIT